MNTFDIQDRLAAQFVRFDQVTVLRAPLKRSLLQIGYKLLDGCLIHSVQRRGTETWKDVLGQLAFHCSNRAGFPVGPSLVVLPAPVNALPEGDNRAEVHRPFVGVVKLILGKKVWMTWDLDLGKPDDPQQRYFTEEQLKRIIETAEGQHRVLFALLAGTGMRIGEAAGLHVDDLDLDNCVIYVRRAVWNGTIPENQERCQGD